MQRFVTWKWHDLLHHAVGSLRSCRILQVYGEIGIDHGFLPQKFIPVDNYFSEELCWQWENGDGPEMRDIRLKAGVEAEYIIQGRENHGPIPLSFAIILTYRL